MTKRDTLNLLINLDKQIGYYLLKGSIIPGNRYFRIGEERGIFQQLLTLEAEEREGQLHRESVEKGEVFLEQVVREGFFGFRKLAGLLLSSTSFLLFVLFHSR